MTDDRTVLVTGATGQQGGAVARELLARGWAVRALVRDPGRPAAKELDALGATLVEGDLDDAGSLRAATAGAYGVFSVQALAYEPETLAAEVRQGTAIADAAERSGVAHFVYSSVGGAERDTGIDHFESKAEIERHLDGLDLPATVVRPVFFMENLLHYAEPPASGERVLALPVDPAKPMQMIATTDIGHLVADAFDRPEEFVGRRWEVAGDALTFGRVAEVYERITGVPTRFEPLPIEERMFAWFAESGYQADVDAVRRQHPGLLTFERFLTQRLSG